MADTKLYFRVIKDSFIGNKLILAESGEVVLVETDLSKGGMRPGSNLQRVNEDGSDLTEEQLADENRATIRAQKVLADAAAEEQRRKTAALRAEIENELRSKIEAEVREKLAGEAKANANAIKPAGATNVGTGNDSFA